MANRQTQNNANKTEQVQLYKMGNYSKITIAFMAIAALMLLYAVITHSGMAFLIAILQFILLLISRLIGLQIISHKFKFTYFIPVIISLLLIYPYYVGVTSFFGESLLYTISPMSYSSRNAEIMWPTSKIAALVPTPISTTGHIYSDDNDYLNIALINTTKEQYRSYAEECISRGFTLELNEESNRMVAFNKDGYKLELSYYSTDSEMSVRIKAPYKMEKLRWPKNELVQLLPKPASEIGCEPNESNNYYSVYVGDTTKDAFNEYVDACIDAGFDVDYNRNDDYFSADNKDGVHVYMRYEGNGVMQLSIDNYK